MRPTTVRSNRPSLHHPRSSPIPTLPTTSSIYQQQQQILYAPINNSMVTLQPCGTAFHPSYIYPGAQPHISSSNSIPLHLQGKNNRWHSKNKSSRSQQYYQQQQQAFYNSKPVMLIDQPPTSVTPISPSATSFLVASSTFTHGPLPGEHYNNNSGITQLLPQPYYKPSDVQQTFCLIQDRQNVQQQQHPIQTSYYNISATNTCSLQAVNANSSFPLSNLSSYSSLATFANNQFPASMQSSSFFSNPSVGLMFPPPQDKSLPLPTLEFSSLKHNTNKIGSNICESRVVPLSYDDNSNGWPSQIETSSKNLYDVQIASDSKNLESTNCPLQTSTSAAAKTDEEHYSDESSTSFDFTIEAEKMVSALCNTTSSNDLGKEESRSDKIDSTPLFSGAGDNVPSKTTWFTDFSSEYKNGTSIGTQTDGLLTDKSQYPELIRKTTYWGCTEAEIVLGCDFLQTDSKRNWLACLSSATKTAITKSSTCIPVFAGDRVFADDLINALLRISNGWLSLDNYLNKQYFPNLLDRLDPEFIMCFHMWEESTHELLKQITQTFRKFGENNEAADIEQKRKEVCGSSFFPGDVSLYTDCDLLVPLSSSSFLQQNATEKISRENPHITSAPSSASSLHNFQYNSDQQEQQTMNHKESKLRSKWTITENLSSMINTTRSASNVSVCHNDITNLTSSKLRTKDTFLSRKFDSTQKSLNAEFCQLKNKVMENNIGITKDRKQNYTLENKLSAFTDNTEPNRLQNSAMSVPVNYKGLYAQNCMSFTSFPLAGQSDSSYPVYNPRILTYGGTVYPSSALYPITESNSRSDRITEQTYGIKSANVNPIYTFGRSQAEQMELPAVPRNKVTLLSQIEPRTFDKESEEMAANLSAWFASMRNAQLPATVSTFEEATMNENSTSRLFSQQGMPKYSIGIPKQPQIDANRQFQALQNLSNIQSTPWAAGNLIGNRPQVQYAPEEYDSSEDVRVYMKPGSYNVPKKRHQKKANRRSDSNATTRNAHANNYHNVCGKAKNTPASSTPLSHVNLSVFPVNTSNTALIKNSFPSASQLPTPLFNLENSPRILKRMESLSQNTHRDVTWKAACASAEILLEALNIKDCTGTADKINCGNTEKVENKNTDKTSSTISQQNDLKLRKRNNIDCVSSYEASEDDSDSTCRLSPSMSVISVSQPRENENALSIKTNVKTDSWLIRTLNNASIASKQKRCKEDANRRCSESSNSSAFADVKLDQLASPTAADADTKVSTIISDSEYPAISGEHVLDSFPKKETKELEGYVGKATYSETVRRSMKSNIARSGRKESYKACATNSPTICDTVIPISGRRSQRKDPEQFYQLLHKSRKTVDKKVAKNADNSDLQLEEISCANGKSSNVTLKSSTNMKTHGKKKDSERLESKCVGKSCDRSWSVWYSSKKKQSLSCLAFSKLEVIYQTVWQMDEAKIFKYPFSCGNKNVQSSSTKMIEDCCKVVKNPMFLEIIEYKLKNRVYHKVEHAVKDFRRVIHNARLCHQYDDERTKKIEVLSKKLEDLLQEHFGDWDFDTIGSPRENSTLHLRLKTSGQKSIAGRYDGTKKSISSLTTENSSLH